jgi:sugar transferase (PEP-CTERM system associated)
MVRLFNVYIPARSLFLVLAEALLTTVCLLAAFALRLRSDFELALVYEQGLFKILVASSVLMICMYYYDLYDSQMLHRPMEVLTRLFQVLGTATVILALLYYLFPQVQLGRQSLMLWVAFSGPTLLGWRWLFQFLNKYQRLSQRTLILGTGSTGAAVMTEINARPELGLTLLGYVGNAPSETDAHETPFLGRLEQLSEVVEQRRVQRIVLAVEDRRGRLPVDALLELKKTGVIIQDAPELYEAVTGRVLLAALRPSWLLFSDGFCVSRPTLVYKRLASLIFGTAAALITAPLMVIVALAIWLDSGRPILFRQKRIGKGGKPFMILKFRSMRADADGDGAARPAAYNDSRVTRVGHFIRRLRLDELPQLFNIIRGDMYFVGPRPFAANEEIDFSKTIPFYSHRWTVRPGATGWAQVRRGYCATREDNLEKLAYDLYYVKNLSLGLDLLVLFETVKILLLGRGGR